MGLDGEREVLAIGGSAILIGTTEGTTCTATMFAEPEAAAPLDLTPPRGPNGAGGTGQATPRSAVTPDEGISQVGDHAFLVRRRVVDAFLESPTRMITSARVLPHHLGMRLFGIRDGSLLHKLGLRHGDTLRAINGDMASPDEAIEAYTRLRHAERLTVSILRNGEPLVLEYSVER